MESFNPDVADIKKFLVTRLSLGLLVPLVITVILIAMFFVLNTRIRDIEVVTKLVNIERSLLKDKNLPWAIEQYKQIALNNKSAVIQARLGGLYFYLDPKNPGPAVEHLKLAKEIDPSYFETYTNLTWIYVVGSQTNDAIREGTRALELNPLDAITLNNLAWLYATSNDPGIHNLQLAQKYAKKAVELTLEKFAPYLDTLAEVHYRQGGTANLELALKYFRKAVELAPRDELQDYNKRFHERFPNETP